MSHPPPPPPGPPHQPPPHQPSPDHTARNVVLAVVAVVVLLCGGLSWAVVAVVSNVRDTVDEVTDGFDTSYRGSDGDPLTVEEGEGFSIRDIDYGAGWQVEEDGSAIDGLTATSDRSGAGTARIALVVRLKQGEEVLTELSCTAPASIGRGESVALSCTGGAPAAGWDSIEVNDTALFG